MTRTPSDPVLEERLRSLRDLIDERWSAHTMSHESLAEALREYKSIANEWQKSFSDFRGEYVTDAEWKAEHRALLMRVDALERAVSQNSTEQATARNIFTNGRNLILLAVAIVGIVITVVAYLNRV